MTFPRVIGNFFFSIVYHAVSARGARCVHAGTFLRSPHRDCVAFRAGPSSAAVIKGIAGTSNAPVARRNQVAHVREGENVVAPPPPPSGESHTIRVYNELLDLTGVKREPAKREFCMNLSYVRGVKVEGREISYGVVTRDAPLFPRGRLISFENQVKIERCRRREEARVGGARKQPVL